MSMSQEEIEALMNGADDFVADESSDDTEIEEIQEPEEVTSDDNFDDILAGIDGIVESDTSEDLPSDDNFDDILAGIEGIEDDSTPVDAPPASESIEDLIEQNQYPLPVSNENKVVNQLNEVADDSEEKASQIFDVLSFILDENNEIASHNKQMAEFIEKQSELLDSLSVKFPNITVFKENSNTAKELEKITKSISTNLDAQNNKVFEAMELMQFHDINRQKIERVMAVIRKLNSYLNGIFEDDTDKPEVQIAKHISGDSNSIVGGDDLEALIAEFGE